MQYHSRFRACMLTLAFLALPSFADDNSSGKQTIFNDDNYQPRGAYNSLPPPPARPAGKNRKPATRSQTGKPVKVNWHWDSHRFSSQKSKQGKSHSGVFYYSVNNNRINTSNVCDNYTKGSLIYRDCRKAAKQHFNKECSSNFTAACLAAGMTP